MQPLDSRRVRPKPTITEKQCTTCKHKEYIPQPEFILKPLLILKLSVVHALRPLDIDTGEHERVPHGYRMHKAMISFA
eukprot:9804380-Karenia_brevis.AAC.1